MIVGTLLIGFILGSCAELPEKTVIAQQTSNTQEFKPIDMGAFVAVYRYQGIPEMFYYIVYDKETKVMYYLSNVGYNSQRNLSPLYNADGSLKIWDGK